MTVAPPIAIACGASSPNATLAISSNPTQSATPSGSARRCACEIICCLPEDAAKRILGDRSARLDVGAADVYSVPGRADNDLVDANVRRLRCDPANGLTEIGRLQHALALFRRRRDR